VRHLTGPHDAVVVTPSNVLAMILEPAWLETLIDGPGAGERGHAPEPSTRTTTGGTARFRRRATRRSRPDDDSDPGGPTTPHRGGLGAGSSSGRRQNEASPWTPERSISAPRMARRASMSTHHGCAARSPRAPPRSPRSGRQEARRRRGRQRPAQRGSRRGRGRAAPGVPGPPRRGGLAPQARDRRRAGELVAMRRADVNVTERHALVVRFKGGQGRASLFGAQTAEALDRDIRVRRSHRLAATPALRPGQRGKEFSNDASSRCPHADRSAPRCATWWLSCSRDGGVDVAVRVRPHLRWRPLHRRAADANNPRGDRHPALAERDERPCPTAISWVPTVGLPARLSRAQAAVFRGLAADGRLGSAPDRAVRSLPR